MKYKATASGRWTEQCHYVGQLARSAECGIARGLQAAPPAIASTAWHSLRHEQWRGARSPHDADAAVERGRRRRWRAIGNRGLEQRKVSRPRNRINGRRLFKVLQVEANADGRCTASNKLFLSDAPGMGGRRRNPAPIRPRPPWPQHHANEASTSPSTPRHWPMRRPSTTRWTR